MDSSKHDKVRLNHHSPSKYRLDIAEANNFRELERAVLASEARKKEEERQRRMSLGLPPEEEKKGFIGSFKAMFKRPAKDEGNVVR
jgi:hypothetical protein